METWSIISEYPNYEVSNIGNIRNKNTKKILKQTINNGYFRVCVRKNNKSITCLVHRLVASAFLETNIKKNIINHIDGNKLNNFASNLEWVTQKENINHAILNNLIKINTVSIIQLDMNEKEIKIFNSIKEIEESYDFDRSFIIRVCKKQAKSAYGYKWKYLENKEIINNFDGKNIAEFSNYLINTNGDVYSKKSKKLLKPIINKNGHAYVSLINENTGKKHNFYISRLVAELYLNNENNFSIVIHKNGNKSDNRLENLEWSRYINQHTAY
jgi:hypothetical protein